MTVALKETTTGTEAVVHAYDSSAGFSMQE